jgi:hypothetical protein
MSVMNFDGTGAANLVNITYGMGSGYQWLIELIRNSLQVKAKNIGGYGYMTSDGRLVRYVTDDGPGLDAKDLEAYFTKFGEGAGAHGVGAKFGLGSRVATLPWNPQGVVIVSKHESELFPVLIKMLWNPLKKVYEVEEQIVPDVGPVRVVTAGWYYENIDPTIAWHELIKSETGFVVVLLGSDTHPHTARDGDPNRPEEAEVRGPQRYLNRRLVRLPEGTSIKVQIVEDITSSKKSRASVSPAEKVSIGDKVYRLHSRDIIGIEEALRLAKTADGKNPKVVAHNTVMVDDHGTELDWYLLAKEDHASEGRIDRISDNDTIMVCYQQDGLLEAYESYTKSKLNLFGIYSDVKNRVRLIIRPPVMNPVTHIGVQPDGARATLKWGLGKPLPVEEWGERFRDNLPDEIRDAIAAEYSGDSEDLDKALNEALKDMRKRRRELHKLPRVKPETGGETADPSEEKVTAFPAIPPSTSTTKRKWTRRGGKVTHTAPESHVEGGEDPKDPKDDKGGTLEVKFDTTVESPYLAQLTPTTAEPEILLVNPDHPLFKGTVEQIALFYGDDDKNVSMREAKLQFAIELVSATEHILELVKANPVLYTADIRDKMLSMAALTTRAAGDVTLTRLIMEKVGRELKRKTKTAA